ncbi:hypothetical protein [Streptomyces cavernicola]|uniref:Uncharacterized protein n=1 Tax=Streptomyces cavernicola TaxID=3043613 RepID=A0ABT6SI39_9ACTN|nr:hypothetical protein [Streptomyces sp. B-S-A6]MDI3407867.1 hypothetical protein [Streptomyces sp. B-S-A6]
MSTHRDGDDQLSGEAHPPETASHLGPTAERDGAFSLDDIAEMIGEALRQPPADDRGEQAALAAFRSARATNDAGVRTRRRDDWRPATRRRRRARGGALALAASTLLGGIAVASIGVVDSTRHPAPKVPTSSPLRSPAPTRGEQDARPTEPTTSPTASASHPGTVKDLEAHCRAYKKGKGRGHALKATAWQRLARAAGGERQIPGFCARLTGAVADLTPEPPKPDKATNKPTNKPTNEPQKTGKTKSTKNAEETGKGQGKPSAEAQQSIGSDRR